MSENNVEKLVFIYNADSGMVNTVKDFWHKALRPSTYKCNLCAQTFSPFGMKKEWKDAKYPSAYLLKNGTLKLLITQEEMDKVPSINEMEKLVSSKLK
jgi:hypothetical protein